MNFYKRYKVTQLYFSNAMRLSIVTDSCSQTGAVCSLLCLVKSKFLQRIVTVSRCSQLCSCWSEPISNVPIAGIAFSLILLVRRSAILAVAGDIVTGKEPVSVGKEKLFCLKRVRPRMFRNGPYVVSLYLYVTVLRLAVLSR